MSKEQIIFNAMQIDGMVSEWDLDLIYDLAQEYIQPKGFALEIGGWKGRSGYVIGSVCKEKQAQMYEIDTYRGVEDPFSDKNQPGNLGGYYEAFSNPEFYKTTQKNLEGLPIIFLIGDSNEMIHKVPDKTIDFIFIDGNHRPPTIDNDIKNCIQKMRLGGMLTGHDHGNPDGDVHGAVKRVLHDEFIVSVRPLIGDPKYCLTIWQHIIKESDYEI